MVEDLTASYVALKLENEILQAQVKRLMEENAALQAQIPELQKPGAPKEDEPLRKPSEAYEPPEFPEFPESPERLQTPAARASQKPWKPPGTTEPGGPSDIKEPRDPSAIRESRGPSAIREPKGPSVIRETRDPSAIRETRDPSAIRELTGLSEIKEPPETKECGGPSAIREFRGFPEVKEPHSSPKFQEHWGPQEPPEAKESRDSTAAWGLQEPSKAKEACNSPELQELSPWKLPASKEPQEIQEALESSGIQKPQAFSGGYDLPAVCEAGPRDNQGTPALKEFQNPQVYNPTNDEGSQKVPEHQETSSQLEPLGDPAAQEPLEPWVPQEPLDPSDAEEFIEFSVPEESLEGLIVVRTGTAHTHGELEAATVPLEYPLAISGDSRKLSEFLVQLTGYLRTRGHLYPTEVALVSFVSSFFSSEAGRWLEPLIDSQSPLLEQFERFLRVLQNTFDNPESMEVANHGLPQLHQGEEGLAHRYSTRFHLNAQELDLDESTFCIQFQEELASSTQNELSCPSPATNLSDIIIQCVTLEEKADSDTSASEEENGSESPPTENQPVQGTSNRPHLSEAERARRREGHLCLYCGHPGHFARDCPVKPHRAQQAGNMEARR
ncbi:retrotransposon Gag-like protein 3 [Acomys russatus]|uniref:retrotransposon Gag-like protein 3 n=1 Tax=Acomys russatus TaxID=60746 RepID=UPI0021E22D89|nr:retrotransposon Gag-like protein 3 [Acomys russatus]